MIYSKTVDEMIRELNRLIVQAGETVEYTRKRMEANSEIAVFYSRFWDFIATRTEEMSGKLTRILCYISDMTQRPDEISARFLIIKAMEDAAFQSGITAFQAGLTTARARPEHREVFLTICDKYDSLARNAWIRAGRIAEFLQELSALIFQDMRKNAEQKIRQAAEKGMTAVRDLTGDPALPYAYIADEIREITEELSAMPLEEVTVSRLEDYLFRLEIIAFAADADALRSPFHRTLFDGIRVFREQVGEAAEFFRSLPSDVIRTSAEPGGASGKPEVVGGKRNISEAVTAESYRELEFRGNILLFYLKGEIRKLGDSLLDEEQKSAFDIICGQMQQALRLMKQEPEIEKFSEKEENVLPDGTEKIAAEGMNDGRIAGLLQQVYREMTLQADGLGIYGTAIQYIAEEWKRVFLNPVHPYGK